MVAHQGGQSSTLRALRSSRRTVTRRNGLPELHTVHGPCCATPSRHRRRAPQCGADSHEYRQDDCTGDEIGMPKTHFLGRTPAVTVRASEGEGLSSPTYWKSRTYCASCASNSCNTQCSTSTLTSSFSESRSPQPHTSSIVDTVDIDGDPPRKRHSHCTVHQVSHTILNHVPSHRMHLDRAYNIITHAHTQT